MQIISTAREFASRTWTAAGDAISDDTGQDLIEYGLLASLIAVVCIACINSLATVISGLFSTIGTGISNA